MTRQSAVERAPAQAQRPRRLAHVAVEAGECLLDEQPLDLLQRHLLEPRGRRAARGRAEAEVARAQRVALREEHRALDGVVEFADVAGPRVVEQRLDAA